MFSYLRYFSMISAVIVTIAAIALGYYFRNSAEGDLSDLVIKNNKVLTQGFINNVWSEHQMVKMLELFRKHNVTPDNWNRYRGYKENYETFSRDVFKYFEEMPVVHVTIYDSSGAKLLSLNQSGILDTSAMGIQSEDTDEAQSTVLNALSGSVASTVLQDSIFQIADSSRKTGTLVQTAVPILSDSYVPLVAGSAGYDKKSNIKGMVEIYYDVTRQWEQLYQFQYVGTGAIILIFLLLIGTLILVAAKAEGIIAKQHDANLELAAHAAAAETENENKSQFLASISHELRTPLNAIIGFSEIIKNETMGAIGNEQYKDYIKDIHNSGVHLLSLINDILDYSKAEAGKLDMYMDEVDVTKLIHSSMRLVSPRAEHAQVTLLTEVPKEHFVIHTDGKKVKQILLNLLSNAVKFTPEGGSITVSLWQDVMENSLSVEVKDSGIGIAPKDISKALAPFGQVDSALSRKYEGTGLGLPLTKKFVEIMGGTFVMESEEGQGTSVRFSLPMNVVSAAEEEAPKALETRAAEPQAQAVPAAAPIIAATAAETPAPQSAEAFSAPPPAEPTEPEIPEPQAEEAVQPQPFEVPATEDLERNVAEEAPAESEPFVNPLQDPALTQAPSKQGFSESAFEVPTDTSEPSER
ncbi:MAG: HAMP domain-containing sensor histidine kinase [Rickettsiales bacterium]|nr:HAMP domain-containing sensor histidine kinase [Rickettsiales bacterium]